MAAWQTRARTCTHDDTARFIDVRAHLHSCTYARQDTYDPKFATHIETEYHFEKKQKLIFRILVRRVKLNMINEKLRANFFSTTLLRRRRLLQDVDNPGTPLAPGCSQVRLCAFLIDGGVSVLSQTDRDRDVCVCVYVCVCV